MHNGILYLCWMLGICRKYFTTFTTILTTLDTQTSELPLNIQHWEDASLSKFCNGVEFPASPKHSHITSDSVNMMFG